MTSQIASKGLSSFGVTWQNWFRAQILLVAVLFAPVFVNAKDAEKDAVKRDYVKIVGSSTVFPYTKRVATAFTKDAAQSDPVIETTSSGSGLVAFCTGLGLKYPDIANASRPMKKTEWDYCQKNGVTNITEIYFGNDGLTLVKSRFGEQFNLSRLQLYKAIAAKVPVNGKLVVNPNRNWSDIDDDFPNVPILIFGPTNAHGSYGSFVKLVLPETCKNDLFYFQVKKRKLKDPGKFEQYLKEVCSELRIDGAYIGADQPIEQTLKVLITNPMLWLSLVIRTYSIGAPACKRFVSMGSSHVFIQSAIIAIFCRVRCISISKMLIASLCPA